MTVRIRLAGLEAELDIAGVWSVDQVGDVSPRVARALVRFLNRAYGKDWEPAFGVYEPSHRNASAREVAIDVGAEVIELEPVESARDRVY